MTFAIYYRSILVSVALLGCVTAGAVGGANEIPAWFRSRLATSRFCAVCEVAVSTTARKEKKWKIVQLYRGRQKSLLEFTVRLEDAEIGSRHLLIFCRNSGPKQRTYTASLEVEDGAVRPQLDEWATGFDLPRARIELRRIAALFKK